jgi:hypothetical protein
LRTILIGDEHTFGPVPPDADAHVSAEWPFLSSTPAS